MARIDRVRRAEMRLRPAQRTECCDCPAPGRFTCSIDLDGSGPPPPAVCERCGKPRRVILLDLSRAD